MSDRGIIAFLSLTTIFAMTVPAQATNTVAEAYLLQGKRYADSGRLLDALQCAEKALEEAQNDPDDAEKAAMYNNRGEIERRLAEQGTSQRQQYLENAVTDLSHAIKIKEAIYQKDSLSVIRPIDNLARVYYEMQEFALSESLFRKALKIRESKQGAGSPDCLEELLFLGKIADDQQRYLDAEALFRRCIGIASHAYGANSTVVAKAQKDLAKTLVTEGKYPEAKRQISSARKIFTAKLGYGSKESSDCLAVEKQIP